MDQQVGTPITPVDEPKKSRTGLIIGIVILVILCCCCASIVIVYQWLGDIIVNIFRQIQIGWLPNLILL